MDNVYKMVNGYIAKNNQSQSNGMGNHTTGRWRYCVELVKLGWEAYAFEPVPSRTEDQVIIKWRKEGLEEIHLKMGFTDQCMWLQYLEEKYKREKKDEIT